MNIYFFQTFIFLFIIFVLTKSSTLILKRMKSEIDISIDFTNKTKLTKTEVEYLLRNISQKSVFNHYFIYDNYEFSYIYPGNVHYFNHHRFQYKNSFCLAIRFEMEYAFEFKISSAISNCKFITGDAKFDSTYSSTFSNKHNFSFFNQNFREYLLSLEPIIREAYFTNNGIFLVIWNNIENLDMLNRLLQTKKFITDNKNPFYSLMDIYENDPIESVKKNSLKHIYKYRTSKRKKTKINSIFNEALNSNNLELKLECIRIMREESYDYLENILINFNKYENEEKIDIIKTAQNCNYNIDSNLLEKIFINHKNDDVRKEILSYISKKYPHSSINFMIDQIPNCSQTVILEIIKTVGKIKNIELIKSVQKQIIQSNTDSPRITNTLQNAFKEVYKGKTDLTQGWISIDDSDPLNGALSSNSSEKGKLSIKSTKGVNK